MTAASGISGLPSAFSRTLSSRSRWRTAAMPCRVSSATGRCSSGVAASTSLRCCLPGRSRFGFGRCGTSGGGVKCGRWRRRSSPPSRRGPAPARSVASLAATIVASAPRSRRSPAGRRSRRSPRSPSRSRRGRRGPSLRAAGGAVLHDGLEALLAREQLEEPGAARLLLGRHDRQDADAVEVLLGLDAAAGRRPTDPLGRIVPSRTPRGSRAPAARQVHEPSGAELVSSISMRTDIGAPPYRFTSRRLQ